MDELKGAADPAVIASLQNDFFVSDFGIRNVEIVGPQVGKQLRKQAILATLYSLAGMLIYLALRFEWIYGVAAVLTVFHDTLITVGIFSLLDKEISLTVIAAILTLIGYSNNDTIVVFDRIRENIKLLRRENLADIVNKSINQTLSRTILTAGLTFLTVLALFLFGGEVLHGFSLALVIGILIGTYSSIAIAAPILVAYQDWRTKRGQRPIAMPLRGSGRAPAEGESQGLNEESCSVNFWQQVSAKWHKIINLPAEAGDAKEREQEGRSRCLRCRRVWCRRSPCLKTALLSPGTGSRPSGD